MKFTTTGWICIFKSSVRNSYQVSFNLLSTNLLFSTGTLETDIIFANFFRLIVNAHFSILLIVTWYYQKLMSNPEMSQITEYWLPSIFIQSCLFLDSKIIQYYSSESETITHDNYEYTGGLSTREMHNQVRVWLRNNENIGV